MCLLPTVVLRPGLFPEHHGHAGRPTGRLRDPLARAAGFHGPRTNNAIIGKEISSMKSKATPMTTSTKDSGRIRLGGGWRLPVAKPAH
jgi:hypothetical protein